MPGYADAPLPHARPQGPYPFRPYRPSGLVQAPVIVVEGPAYSGKTWEIIQATKDSRICRTWWIDWGGKSVIDEYGGLDGVDVEVLPHDGTIWSVLSLVEQAHVHARDIVSRDGAPMLVIDSAAIEWRALLWLAHRLTMASPSVQRRIENNAAARADSHKIPENVWSDIHGLHEQFWRLLRTFPGIVVLTARGGEVAAYDEDGNLIPGERAYKVTGHRDLPFDATAWVRTSTSGPPVVIGAKSAHSPLRPGQDEPRACPSLSWLLFELLGYEPRPWEPDLRMEELRQVAAGEPHPTEVNWDERLAEADRIDEPAQRRDALNNVWQAARFAQVRWPGTVPDDLIGRIEKAAFQAGEDIRLGDNPGGNPSNDGLSTDDDNPTDEAGEVKDPLLDLLDNTQPARTGEGVTGDGNQE